MVDSFQPWQEMRDGYNNSQTARLRGYGMRARGWNETRRAINELVREVREIERMLDLADARDESACAL